MAEETVRRRTGTVKQFFREAVERGYIATNPFENLTSTTQGNAKLQFFVESHVVEVCMDHCPCVDWRTILALARYGGLRCPSELVSLRWSDVDLPGGKMIVNATKTE
ncbi:integrase, partial [bacterium]|nr:integrase [bacterium]